MGWFKQTVDKPNSSLSADRRGSLSMPDILSFKVSQKNQEDLKSGIERPRKRGRRRNDEDMHEEVMPTGGSSTRRSATRRDPRTGQFLPKAQQPSAPSQEEKTEENASQGAAPQKEVKAIYPHKKFQVSPSSVGDPPWRREQTSDCRLCSRARPSWPTGSTSLPSRGTRAATGASRTSTRCTAACSSRVCCGLAPTAPAASTTSVRSSRSSAATQITHN
mgnify:CR=1 FL=1